MILDFLLSPVTDKNTFTGGIIDNVVQSRESSRQIQNRLTREAFDLKRREVEALERLARKV